MDHFWIEVTKVKDKPVRLWSCGRCGATANGTPANRWIPETNFLHRTYLNTVVRILLPEPNPEAKVNSWLHEDAYRKHPEMRAMDRAYVLKRVKSATGGS